MASIGDMTVTIRAVDEVTPVLRRLKRDLWWYQHGGQITGALIALGSFVAGLLLGGSV